MESSHAHQLILPTDKRNPCFSLYVSEDERFIHVFYGLELFEVARCRPKNLRPASASPLWLMALDEIARISQALHIAVPGGFSENLKRQRLALPGVDREHAAEQQRILCDLDYVPIGKGQRRWRIGEFLAGAELQAMV